MDIYFTHGTKSALLVITASKGNIGTLEKKGM